MIEVEKKFILSQEQFDIFNNSNSNFLGSRIFTDIYYDTDDLQLTLQDKWLRSRDGSFELKLSLCLGATRLVDQYEELTDERAIKKALDMEIDNDLSSQLEALGYKPFCVCTTTRLKHKNGEFIIDLDKVDFQDFNYYIGEIEVMVNTKEEVGSAIDNILVYAKQLGLMIAPVRGKVIEYLKRKRPNHYQKLISAGVVFDHE